MKKLSRTIADISKSIVRMNKITLSDVYSLNNKCC